MESAPRTSRKPARAAAKRDQEAWLNGTSPDEAPSSPRRRAAGSPRRDRGGVRDERPRVGPLPGPPLLTLPSMPSMPAVAPNRQPAPDPYPYGPRPDEWAGRWQDWDDEEDVEPWDEDFAAHDADWGAAHDWDDSGESRAITSSRSRARSAARPLTAEVTAARALVPVAHESPLTPQAPSPAGRSLVSQQSLPLVTTIKPRAVAPRRPRLNTEMLVRQARSPWNVARLLLALVALVAAGWSATAKAGEPPQPLMAGFSVTSDSHSVPTIASLVQPFTQFERTDLYDSEAQYWDWRDAACSAAVSAETLTAWGVKGATIGSLIDAIGPDISLDGGLLREEGFQRGAAHFGFRADIHHDLTYNQILYLANQLGIPVIVNVRISYGYYHFFDSGHFLVVTGGDDQGVRIVDSSLYKIHYLPLDIFNAMFTHREFILVPQDYKYTIPNV
jgi:hypothetical protein